MLAWHLEFIMDVINTAQTGKAQELFDLAYELESLVLEMPESLEYVYETLGELTELFPDSLAYDDYEVEDFDQRWFQLHWCRSAATVKRPPSTRSKP